MTVASAIYLIAVVIRLPWQLQQYVNNSFVLGHIESTFGMEVHCDNKHQPHTLLL